MHKRTQFTFTMIKASRPRNIGRANSAWLNRLRPSALKDPVTREDARAGALKVRKTCHSVQTTQ